MINLHIYPTPFTHESRVFRETAFLAQAASFGRILMAGIGRSDLPATQSLDEKRHIYRFARDPGIGLVGKSLTTLRWLRRVHQAFRNEPLACINCHSLPVLPLGVLLAAQTGAKLIYDAHELETETHGMRGMRWLGSRLMERMLIRRADAVIVVSDSIAEWYRRTYRIRRPTVVLNCPEYAAPGRSDKLRSALGIDAARRIYLYQGALTVARGIESMCDAFDQLPTPRPMLVIMGDGPLREFVQARAARNADIRYLPAVAPQDVLHYTASADVGLCLCEHTCLSHYFCMPNKLFEYIHAGIPVISSDLPELRRVVNDEQTGIVTADHRPQSLIAAILAMEQRPPQSFASALRAAAVKYGWPHQTVALADVYRGLGFVPADNTITGGARC